ncbi:MAG: PEP-CTERM sorting domain-containing protein [Planctomycetota bacterium]
MGVTLLATNAYALRVAWNVDIHQDKFLDGANDFHIEGVLESGEPWPGTEDPPELISHIDGPFTTFNSSITEAIGGRPFYDFGADWTVVDTNIYPTGYIPYCNWIHLGLEFDETCHNVGYWITGWWTQDGVDPAYNPMYGFRVEDLEPQQTITIQNASSVNTELIAMDLAILPASSPFLLEDLNADYFAAHTEFPWVEVPITQPIPMLGDGYGIDSFFDVSIEDVMGRRLGPSEILLSRQYSSYEGASTDYFWNFELHEAHIPEPGTLLLLAPALLGFAGLLRRRLK